MLTTATIPTRIPTFPGPLVNTVWMQVKPIPTNQGKRFELAPGFWIVREVTAWPVSVLDTAALRPLDTSVEPVPRQFPFPDWHLEAACAGTAPSSDDIFFGVDDEERPALTPSAITAARAYCKICPVARECLTWALSAQTATYSFDGEGERFGIWAGTTGRQRAELRLRMRRGVSVELIIQETLGAPAAQ